MEVYSLTCQERKIKLKPDQLTIKLIGQIFSLLPDSIILLSREDGTVETPDELGILMVWMSLPSTRLKESQLL